MRSTARFAVVAAVLALLPVAASGAAPPPLPREAQEQLDLALQVYLTPARRVQEGEKVAPEEWDPAIKQFTRAYELAPTHPKVLDGLRYLADAHMRREQFLAAMAWANAFMAGTSKDTDAARRAASVQ